MEQVTVLNAVEYSVRSVVGPNGQGIAITLTVCAPDGTTAQRWPSVFLPSANAEAMAQGVLAEIRRLRSATQ